MISLHVLELGVQTRCEVRARLFREESDEYTANEVVRLEVKCSKLRHHLVSFHGDPNGPRYVKSLISLRRKLLHKHPFGPERQKNGVQLVGDKSEDFGLWNAIVFDFLQLSVYVSNQLCHPAGRGQIQAKTKIM